MKHDVNVKFKIKYVYLGLLLILIGGFFLFRYFHINNIEYGLLEIVAFITGSTATMTLIYHSLNLENQIETQKYNNVLYRSKYTYDLIAEWHHPNMMDSISVLRKLLTTPIRVKELSDPNKIEEFAEYLSKNMKERQHLVLILNYFENISMMVETDHVDMDIVKRSFKSMFVSHYQKLENYINYRQKEYPDSWYYFETLSKKWRKETITA